MFKKHPALTPAGPWRTLGTDHVSRRRHACDYRCTDQAANPAKVNDLIQRITNAIIRQEGMPAEYSNPGNFSRRGAPVAKASVPMENGFWLPDIPRAGRCWP